MTANEIPVGAGFLGVITRADWHAHWKAGEPIHGQYVHVTVMVPVASYGGSYLKDLLKLHANHLPSTSSSQLSSRDSLWVVGVRESRSLKVRVFDWDSPRHETHLEEVHRLFSAGQFFETEQCLTTLKDGKVPYL